MSEWDYAFVILFLHKNVCYIVGHSGPVVEIHMSPVRALFELMQTSLKTVILFFLLIQISKNHLLESIHTETISTIHS